MKALVVMPTYDEAESVLEAVGRVLAADPRVDVLVVDDGSPRRHGRAGGRAGSG
jgi:dolichol-phosphate mannosyltransferase